MLFRSPSRLLPGAQRLPLLLRRVQISHSSRERLLTVTWRDGVDDEEVVETELGLVVALLSTPVDYEVAGGSSLCSLPLARCGEPENAGASLTATRRTLSYIYSRLTSLALLLAPPSALPHRNSRAAASRRPAVSPATFAGRRPRTWLSSPSWRNPRP